MRNGNKDDNKVKKFGSRWITDAKDLIRKHNFGFTDLEGDLVHGYIFLRDGKHFLIRIEIPSEYPYRPPIIEIPDTAFSERIENGLLKFFRDGWNLEYSLTDMIDEIYRMLGEQPPQEVEVQEVILETEAGMDQKKEDEQEGRKEKGPTPERVTGQPATPSENPQKEILAEELGIIINEYNLEPLTSNISSWVKVFIPVSPSIIHIVEVDFSDYPRQPKIILSAELREKVGEPVKILDSLSTWDPSNPKHVVEVIRELESKLIALGQKNGRTKATPTIGEDPGTKAKNEEYEPSALAGPEAEEHVRKRTLRNELESIRYEYSVNALGSESNLEIFIPVAPSSLSAPQVELDFSRYPERPEVKLAPELKDAIGNPADCLKSLSSWNKSNPGHVVDVLRELEKKLVRLEELKREVQLVKGEFKSEPIPGKGFGNLRVAVMSFGWRTFQFDVDLTNYPDKPIIALRTEAKELLGEYETSLVKALIDWDPSRIHVADVIREVEFAINRAERTNFELQSLVNGISNATYDSHSRKFFVSMEGTMKTKDVRFDFEAMIPSQYPVERPNVRLITQLEDPDIESAVSDAVRDAIGKWNTYSSYLVDVFNEVSNKIYETSILTCVVCHDFRCTKHDLPLDDRDGGESCRHDCPHCGKPYHECCWEKMIKKFGICGWCLKSP